MARKPELVVIAGPNGSGKTSVTRQLLTHVWAADCLYINPDDIAQKEFGGWDSPPAFLQAAKKAELLRGECLEKNRSLVFETVFSAPDKMEFVQAARERGYFVRFFFICTDSPEINISRIHRRQRAGGHGVPPEKVQSRYGRSINQCAAVIKLVDRAYIYDNSVEDTAPALLFRAENGILKKRYRDPVNAWALPVLAALLVT